MNCVEDNIDIQIKCKIWALKSSLCDYENENANIIVNGTITITGEGADNNIKLLDEKNKALIYIIH